MAGCSSCGKSGSVYVVKRPGQPDRTVSTEGAAQTLVRGVQGATYAAEKKR
jgi:hypothetical protein